MFGLFKPKLAPEGPVQFTVEMMIDCPAEEVYRLVDWADPKNAKVELGNTVAPAEGCPGRFRMFMPLMPDLSFEFDVTDAEPGLVYGFDCRVTPQLGRLESSHELYRFEPVDENECKLVLVNTVNFLPGLTVKEMDEEVKRMSLACHNALVKLKVHAELGATTVSAIEAHQFS